MNESISVQKPPYTIVPDGALKDPNLSARAKGVYAYLLSNQESFIIYKKEIVNRFKEGRDAIYKAFDELIEAGWIVATYKRDKGKFGGSDYKVVSHESLCKPQPEKPDTVNPDTEKPDTVNPSLINNNSNKYQIESLTKKKKAQKRTSPSYSAEFESFWSGYPLKKGKLKAYQEFNKLSTTDQEEAIEGAVKYASHLEQLKKVRARGEDVLVPAFKYAQGWITGRRWEDVLELPETAQNANKAVSSHILEDKFGNEAWGVNADGSF